MRKFHFFVCRNGYGHLKRVFSVVRELLQFTECASIIIHCNARQFHNTKTWEDFHVLNKAKNVCFEFEFMQNSPRYSDEETFANTLNWLESLKESKRNIEGTVVIDNDIALLNLFPQAIVMGSFYWKDILDPLKQADWIRFEEELLNKYNPIHIGVEKMAMQSVLNRSQFVGLPWFASPGLGRQTTIHKRKSLLVTGGGTGFYNQRLLEIAMSLKDMGLEIYVDSKLFAFSNASFPLFSFSEEDFSHLKAIICRPGMGILNDCVSYAIPIFAVEDCLNKELMHNADRVVAMKLGIKVTSVEEIVVVLEQENFLAYYHENLLNQVMNGATQAATYLMGVN